MKIIQSRSFEQRVKKFNTAQKKALDEQIKLIIGNPTIGTKKNVISKKYTFTNSKLRPFSIF